MALTRREAAISMQLPQGEPLADEKERPLGDAPHWRREHFIPIRRHALLDLLTSQADLSPPERRRLRDVTRMLDATLHQEFHWHLQAIDAAYAPFDPDDDTRTTTEWSDADRLRMRSELFRSFNHVLERANYQRLSQLQIEEAVGAASEWGVRLYIDFSVFERLEVYARGDVLGRRKRRHWRNWFREEEVDVPIYQRLVVMFSLRASPVLDSDIDASAVYVKLFKNIPKIDVDMLLPGSRIRMTLLDRGKIFLPTVSGAAVTIAKIIKGALWAALTGTFWGLVAFIGFVIGTIGYGVKTFFGYLRTKDKYQHSLTRNLYYQNLDNNAGVFHRLLDEAEEQESREVMIAYYLLWKRAPAEGWSETQLDEAAEEFVRQSIDVDVDFESHDAIVKLLRFGLAERRGDAHYIAVHPQRALARLDAAWDNLFSHS